MLLLLLVSIQVKILVMEIFDSKSELINTQFKRKTELHIDQKKENILCNYCKRTVSNGIRCMGFCVADNDY